MTLKGYRLFDNLVVTEGAAIKENFESWEAEKWEFRED